MLLLLLILLSFTNAFVLITADPQNQQATSAAPHQWHITRQPHLQAHQPTLGGSSARLQVRFVQCVGDSVVVSACRLFCWQHAHQPALGGSSASLQLHIGYLIVMTL
jgi:hypothetical protein